ncbi:predicted protein [Histoplasma capsulatum G186AR]|uniref:Uncharacterized protein n=1 Tax=Ajellomyces capsulatus (strain G186AR / H82 / ATCC MYA-2454 / RMSCC 2432) TaxID=447093 RepID=C0NWX8_AJECG|nr:uncharacterized protein HCBG_07970 [Histoplasma capsulatum G186AR]EEH03844.1 predicted protein [Histoplasma capsulatum G186AR]
MQAQEALVVGSMWFSHQTGWKMRYLRLVISAMLVTLTQLLPANASAIETLQKRKGYLFRTPAASVAEKLSHLTQVDMNLSKWPAIVRLSSHRPPYYAELLNVSNMEAGRRDGNCGLIMICIGVPWAVSSLSIKPMEYVLNSFEDH